MFIQYVLQSVVQVLLDRGAQVNAQTEETGETALTVAACGGYTLAY